MTYRRLPSTGAIQNAIQQIYDFSYDNYKLSSTFIFVRKVEFR